MPRKLLRIDPCASFVQHSGLARRVEPRHQEPAFELAEKHPGGAALDLDDRAGLQLRRLGDHCGGGPAVPQNRYRTGNEQWAHDVRDAGRFAGDAGTGRAFYRYLAVDPASRQCYQIILMLTHDTRLIFYNT